MTTVTSNITSLKDAIESRDAERVSASYADNAVLTILDRDNPPAAPTTYSGLEEIGAFYRDICGRAPSDLIGRTKDRVNWKNAGPAAPGGDVVTSSLGGPLRILTLACDKLKARNERTQSDRAAAGH